MNNRINVHTAFRFHTNFYHSYRGDSLDEKGIGKDIRIIRGLLDDLDRLNSEGIPVRGTWDLENYYSLEKMMKDHCPELTERIGKRVKEGLDEVELMSWNNGLVSASTDKEFQVQLDKSISNPGGSGLADLFDRWVPVLRPQECMYTPSFLKRYSEAGIGTISLYYSAAPFNGFSSFVPPMDFIKRYNPLTLKADGYDHSMTLLPCYNHGDIADRWLSIRKWIMSIRREQMKLTDPRDVLLLIDMDADDEFWAGIDIPVASKLRPSFDGFYRLIKSISTLPYVRFTTPGDYLADHLPAGDVVINQDTADGSFDGYSSWAEKWSNTRLWKIIQKSRDYDDFTTYFLGENQSGITEEISRNLETAMKERLLTLSTTHFGMASPVMNRERLQDGMNRAKKALSASRRALDLAVKSGKMPGPGDGGILLTTEAAREPGSGVVRLADGSYKTVSVESGTHLVGFTDRLPRGENVPRIEQKEGRLEIAAEWGSFSLLFPRISYGTKILNPLLEGVPVIAEREGIRTFIFRGINRFPTAEDQAEWTMTVRTLTGSASLFAELKYRLPETAEYGYDRKKALRLNRGWDHRWREFMPMEIIPRFTGSDDSPNKVIKHNFFNEISRYSLDYGTFSKNRNIDSLNNHITNGWVAVSNGSEGLLAAQHTGLDNNFAFCPMRVREKGGRQQVKLNPFGTYYGRQLRYPTSVTGLGRLFGILMADQLDSYAPSFNGKSGHFALMIQPYRGETPPEDLQRKARVFASAPLEKMN